MFLATREGGWSFCWVYFSICWCIFQCFHLWCIFQCFHFVVYFSMFPFCGVFFSVSILWCIFQCIHFMVYFSMFFGDAGGLAFLVCVLLCILQFLLYIPKFERKKLATREEAGLADQRLPATFPSPSSKVDLQIWGKTNTWRQFITNTLLNLGKCI